MSFLIGKTKTITTMPEDIAGLRRSLIQYLGSLSPETALSGLPLGGDIGPLQSLFQQQLAPVLAQAKEAAGTLTGSSLGNILGATAGRAASDFLLNLLRQRQQAFASLAGGLATQGVNAQTFYQPGFLDYLMQAGREAAPLVATIAKGNPTPAAITKTFNYMGGFITPNVG